MKSLGRMSLLRPQIEDALWRAADEEPVVGDKSDGLVGW